ncbi:TonB-dependent receptor [Phenylobacterium deserti]|uniref:TonB-dependent receptor n=2 Tax=Phenylobacterium deserti TaxID=1914756 RepID=A0A328AHT5_9CAUL|nr:TonB-dependent receptor [Phenylobacterium deserti]
MTGGAAFAQTANVNATQAPEGEVEEVVVTGIRASLQNAQSIKQNAEVFVDSITADDIGALPDRSVTEALSRVPGVSIDRFAAGNDPDHFSVEGSGVVIRGLTFVRGEFNGRDAFSATSGQGLSFQDVPSELMGGVDVFKNQSADMIEGGTAGTVNLRTRVPFDQAGQLIAGSLEYSYGDFRKKGKPTGSLLYSNRWDSSAGEFGLLLNYVHSELATRSDGQKISDWALRGLDAQGQLIPRTDAPLPPGTRQVYLPRGAVNQQQEFNRTRQGYGAAAQWRNNDRTMVATLQFLRSEARQAWTEHALEITTDNVTSNGDSFGVAGTTLEFGDDGLFTNGVISGNTGWRDDQNQGVDARTPIYGLQSNNTTRGVDQRTGNTDIGFNFKWTPTEAWSFNLDLQHVKAKVRNLDAAWWNSTYQNAQIEMRGNDIPLITFLPPSNNGVVPTCPPPGTDTCPTYFNPPNNSFTSPYNNFPRALMDHYEESSAEQDAVRFDVEYKFPDEDGFLRSVRTGVRWADRELNTQFTTYNWGRISEQWGGGGPVWLSDPVDGVPNPQGSPVGGGAPVTQYFEPWAFDNFMRGEVPSAINGQPRLHFAANPVEVYHGLYRELGTLLANEWRPYSENAYWLPLAQRPGVIAGTPFLPGEVNPMQETNKAAYAMLRYGHRFENGINITGNIGVRYTKYERESRGFQSFGLSNFASEADCTRVLDPGQTLTPFCELPAAVRNQARAFANGAVVENSQSTSYDFVLPSFNMRVDFGGGKLVRLGVSKSITPPDVGLLRNYYNINLGGNAQDIVNGTLQGLNWQAGNPQLKPMQALNLDASFEWYFSKVGQLTLSLFHKSLKDVVISGLSRSSFTNNGATFEGIITQPVNSEGTGKVKGFELAYQQTYDFLPGLFSGLGLNANYTYVESEGVNQSALSNTDPLVTSGNRTNVDIAVLPLQGLSKHTFNITPFYEKGPLSVRAAYNWRSKYLLTVRDVIVPYAPIMQEDYGTLDASVFYTVNDHIKVGVQGVNLLANTLRTSSVLNDELLTGARSWHLYDRRYTFSIRGTW